MTEYKITLDKSKLSESPNGVNPLRFCILIGGKSDTKWCMCKDYFGDWVWSAHMKGQEIQAHGFTAATNPKVLESEILTFYAKREDKDLSVEEMSIIMECINSIERELEIPLTQFEVYDNGIVMNVNELWWKYKPYMLSLFLTLVRQGVMWDGKMTFSEFLKFLTVKENCNNPKMITASDISHIETFLKGTLYEAIMNRCYLERKETYTLISSYEIHNYAGFVNYNKKP